MQLLSNQYAHKYYHSSANKLCINFNRSYIIVDEEIPLPQVSRYAISSIMLCFFRQFLHLFEYQN